MAKAAAAGIAALIKARSGCPRCATGQFGRPQAGEERHKATTKVPSIMTMMKWSDSGVAKATDGCRVEPDGVCPHGHSSWLRRLHYI